MRTTHSLVSALRIALPRVLAPVVALTYIALVVPAAPILAGVPPGFVDELAAHGLNVPTTFVFASTGRIFVAERAGALRLVENGILYPTPMVELPVETFAEQGFLGLALNPDFQTSGHITVCYTLYSGNVFNNINRVSRLTVSGDVVDPASEVVLFDDIPTGDGGFHVGGSVGFAPDGSLFVSTGDTAWNPPYPQDLGRLEGKMLRLNADGSVPPDNPFVGVAGARPEIYQYGLRNPFRFSFHPATGDPWIGDVGFNSFEEVNTSSAGANFGWPMYEGNASPPDPTVVDPVYGYDHSEPAAAIIGGCIYEGTEFPPAYRGNYFYADNPLGWIGRVVLDAQHNVVSYEHQWGRTVAWGGGAGPADLKLGPDGALYYCLLNGQLRRIRALDASGVEPPGSSVPSIVSVTLRPNPARRSSFIEFELGAPRRVKAAIFDALGRQVRALADRSLGAGRHAIHWDGRTGHGAPAAAGAYYYRLELPDGLVSRRLILR